MLLDEPHVEWFAEQAPAAQAPFRARSGQDEELDALQRQASVGQRLGDRSFRDRLERVLRARLSNPDNHQLRDSVLQSVNRARAQRAATHIPEAEPRHADAVDNAGYGASLGGSNSLSSPNNLNNLNLVAGASFELLLSIQRMLQQVKRERAAFSNSAVIWQLGVGPTACRPWLPCRRGV